MSNAVWMLMLVVVMVSGCGKQQEATPGATSAPVAAAAPEEQQAQAVADQAAAAAREAQASAQAAASEMSAKIQEFLAQAREYVNSGKFNDAITKAQQVLALDPGNMDAKSIIETAKTKLAEAGKTIAADLQNKLGAFGK